MLRQDGLPRALDVDVVMVVVVWQGGSRGYSFGQIGFDVIMLPVFLEWFGRPHDGFPGWI